MRSYFENIFWTEPERSDNPPDPLGLDSMREELSNILVPCLTGRTHSVIDAFWTLILLRWSSPYVQSDSEIVRGFLDWERRLKLVWAQYEDMHERGFQGTREAKLQGEEEGAPRKAYKRLLLNARAQGLLGIHLRPFQKIGLVKEGELTLTDLALRWTEGSKYPPKLADGRWVQWKTEFEKVQSSGYEVFKRKFRELLKERMTDQYDAFERLGWPEDEAWDKAAERLGSRAGVAILAHQFCSWSHEVRKIWDSLVFDGSKTDESWPNLTVEVPSELYGRRWDAIRAFATRRPTLQELANWHSEEFKERGRGKSDLWLDVVNGHADLYPYNGSQAEGPKGDCRWGNAVAVMKRAK